MSFLNKITLGTKFLFGGWESALDYLLGFLNDYLARDNVAAKVDKVRKTCSWALDWLLKLRAYVPEKWRTEYSIIVDIIADVIAVANDGKLTADEMRGLAQSFSDAKLKWEED